MTREQLRQTMSDTTAVVCTLFGEAANEPIEGQVAVASVIRNRVRNPRWWGVGWKGVCHQHLQFSCWWERNQNTDRVYALAKALHDRQAATGPQSIVGQLEWVAVGVMDDVLIDVTRGSDHYLTTRLLKTAPPQWARGKAPASQVAAHTFFRLEI